MNLVSQEIQKLAVYRPSKQEILLNAIQSCITELYNAAGSAEDSNEVDNYLRAAKPLTDALIACVQMGDGV
ncbi:MAG: hypothetical protein KME38_15035 [Spirirestis rafaelensis WJT71-NPBG6]|jgi:hypothetical protein|nr:hypothetical protein [Spirirestis rafaelensis WJT71-NPBG6]